MARQVSVAKRERTVNILTFYKLRDKYYVRMRSRLSGDRVKSSPEFKNTMTHAHRLGIASRLAAVVYSQLPPSWKLHDLYRKLTGQAINLLKEGIDPNCILKKLNEFMKELGYQKEIKYHIIHPSTTKLQKPQKLKSQSPKQPKKSRTLVKEVERKKAKQVCLFKDIFWYSKDTCNRDFSVNNPLAPLRLSG